MDDDPIERIHLDVPRRLRIGLIAPPYLPVPPHGYAGTERIVAALAEGLHARGHAVTLFASGDSEVSCELVPTVPRALWPTGVRGESEAWLALTLAQVWAASDRFDILHSHIETGGFLLARHCPTPVVTTLHKRLDTSGVAEVLDAMRDVPLVAISESQRRWHPGADWVATVHHGLDFTATPRRTTPGDYLLFVGRIAHEKGVAQAIEVARRTGHRLVMAAKVHETEERLLFEEVVQPAIDDGIVDWRGEVGTAQRDELMAGALATLMLGAWPEPFGLVAIESMATGTPVIARRAGGCTETIEHGVTGYLVDDVDEAVLAVARVGGLPRDRIAGHARTRFSADRMVSRYEDAYRTVLTRRTQPRGDVPRRDRAVAGVPVVRMVVPARRTPDMSVVVTPRADRLGGGGMRARHASAGREVRADRAADDAATDELAISGRDR